MVTLDVLVIRQERPAAFQVILRNGWIFWLPKSQVGNAETFKAGDRETTMEIPEWLAEKKAAMFDWGRLEFAAECVTR